MNIVDDKCTDQRDLCMNERDVCNRCQIGNIRRMLSVSQKNRVQQKCHSERQLRLETFLVDSTIIFTMFIMSHHLWRI